MDKEEFNKLLMEYIDFWEQYHPDEVKDMTDRLEYSTNLEREFIELLNESLLHQKREKLLWLLHKNNRKDKFRLIFAWICHGIITNDPGEKYDNLAQSQETYLRFMLEQRIDSTEDIEQQLKILKRRELKDSSFEVPRKLMEYHLKEIYGESEKERNLKVDGTTKSRKENKKPGRQPSPRKPFRMYLKEEYRVKYDKNKEQFINEFKKIGGKELAILCETLNEFFFEKRENNATAFFETLQMEMNFTTGYRGFTNYFNKNRQSNSIPDMQTRLKKHFG